MVSKETINWFHLMPRRMRMSTSLTHKSYSLVSLGIFLLQKNGTSAATASLISLNPRRKSFVIECFLSVRDVLFKSFLVLLFYALNPVRNFLYLSCCRFELLCFLSCSQSTEVFHQASCKVELQRDSSFDRMSKTKNTFRAK